MTPVDRYIRRATMGMPRRERLDTAAELRVHLNERVRELRKQGFAREEAEHLAVQYMGPVEPVNRRFLGHIFTAPVGWATAALLVVGFAGWFGATHLFAPPEVARPHDAALADVAPLLGEFKAVDVTLPRKAYSFVLAVTRGDSRLVDLSGRARDLSASALRPNQRPAATLVMGFPAAAGTAACGESGRTLVLSKRGGSGLTACVRLPEGATTGAWRDFTIGGLPVVYDTWQPLLAYLPSVLKLEGDGLEPTAGGSAGTPHTVPPDSWLVLSLWTSRAPLEELDGPPPPPSIEELVKAHPGEFPSQN